MYVQDITTLKQQIRSQIIYCDIKENAKNKYSKVYSPNNVKRLVVSPNGVYVELHRKVKDDNILEYPAELLFTLEQHPDYTPIIATLTRPVCSAIEEIVILTKTNEGIPVSPVYKKEQSLNTLIAGYNKGETPVERLRNRFSRLRMFSIVNLSFNDFKKILVNKLPYDLISDLEVVKNYVLTRGVVNEGSDWWNHWSSSNQKNTYDFDEAELTGYFERFAERKSREEKERKVKESKDKQQQETKTALVEVQNGYVSLINLAGKVNNLIATLGFNGLIADTGYKACVLEPLGYNAAMQNVGSYIDKTKECSIEELKKQLDKAKGKLCSQLAENFYHGVDYLINSSYTTSLKVLCDSLDSISIVVPSSCEPTNAVLQEMYGLENKGKSMRDSVVESLALYFRFFVNIAEQKELGEKDYWQREVSKTCYVAK